MIKIMDKKLVKKSCKICAALLIGIIIGYSLTKLIEKDNKEDNVQASCGCSS